MSVEYTPWEGVYAASIDDSTASTVHHETPDTAELLNDRILSVLLSSRPCKFLDGEKREYLTESVKHAMTSLGLRMDREWRGVQLNKSNIYNSINHNWPDKDGALAEFVDDNIRRRVYVLWMREDLYETVVISRELREDLILRDGVSGDIEDIMWQTYPDSDYDSNYADM
jgi:hypothetical protein